MKSIFPFLMFVNSLFVPVSSFLSNGTTDYYNVPTSAAFALGNQGTISVWVKWDPSMVNFQDLVACFFPSGAAEGFSFWIIDRKPSLYISEATGSNIANSTGAALADSTWHHIVVTWNVPLLKFYVAGAQHGADVAITHGVGNAGVDLHIGSDTNTVSSRFLPGNLTQISIFNTYLDATGVAALRDSNRPANLNSHPNRSAGVAWWGMVGPNDNSSFIEDRFGNGHTATPHGGTIVSDVP